MTASVIIVNYRSWDHLEQCLTALLEGAPADDLQFDVVVVDNDSADARLEEFRGRFPGVRFLANRANLGFAHGCNLGASHARGEWLLFCNPDVVGDPRRIARLIEIKRAHPEIAILTARQVDGAGQPQKAFDSFPRAWSSLGFLRMAARRVAPGRYPDPRGRHGGLVRCDWVSGSLLLIAARDFRALGGWSENYWLYMEDVDLCTRARRMGLQVAYTPDVEFVHRHGGASRRDVRTTALTKSETVISKHVYIASHFSGAGAVLFHGLVALKSLVGVVLGTAAGLLTLGLVPALRARVHMFGILAGYYAGALGGRGWLSPRSPNCARV